MKRGSVVGPLLLIAIGGLFLANNIRPDISVMDIIARFWPFVLIAWGGLRLIELLFLASAGKPLPTSGISGGEWALVIFVTLIGSGVYVVNKNVGWWSPMHIRVKGMEVFGEPFDFPLEEKTVAAPRAVRVVIEHGRGNVRVVGAEVEQVKVTGRKTIRAMKRQDADQANRDTPVQLSMKAGAVIVRTNQDRSHGERFISTDLEIEVPKGAVVEAHGQYGDFDVSDIEGSVEVDSDNAGVRVQNIGGNVTVDLRRSDIIRAIDIKGNVELRGRGGDVELENITGHVAVAGNYSGEMQFRNVTKMLRVEDQGRGNSDIRVESTPGQLRIGRGHVTGENLIGPLIINAKSKDVQLSEFTQSANVSVDRGDVELRPGRLPLPKIDVNTRSGRIDLALPEGAKFALKGTAERGEITNDFGQPLEVVEEGRRSTISGTTGSGPEVSLSAERGSVTVRKGSVIAATEAATRI
ncbi:MAG TPA: DUF4097 family beta strand repeat-containing protein [Bryobacteraceae bacterium]|nr:DUF4097 family beta strand repeat-containing protein [Bryobacteraceae bacterium]